MTGRSLESTATLIALSREGDVEARERLIAHCLPLLRRWARGRLPGYARAVADTDDLVQITLMRAVSNLDTFEPRREGAFLSYLRRILLNAVRDEIRATSRRPRGEPIDPETMPQRAPVDAEIGHGVVDAYEKGLEVLGESQRDAVILRVEFGMTFPEVALELGMPSADAARMQVSRALVKLAEAMS